MATSPRSTAQDSFWVFGEFELDAARFELRRRGERVVMQRKPLQVLIYLCRNSERLVPSPELLARVWDVNVTEASLRGAIKVLRRTLLGSATIESSRGYGYRFIPAPARLGTDAPEASGRHPIRTRTEEASGSSDDAPWPPPRPHAFVGRQDELALLDRALAQALRGDPGPVLVAAPAGTGKTWLTREFARRAAAKAFRCLTGQAWEGGGAPAFWPWGPMLEQLAYEGEPLAFDRPLEKASTRFRVFTDVVALLRRRAEQEPLLLVFEDLHWAEESALLLLKFVVEQLHGSRVMILGTYRDIESEVRPGCSRLLGSLQARGQRLSLGPFSRAEVVSLLESETSLEITDALVNRVLHFTGGSPLFVRELIPILERRGEDPDLWQANLPAGLREAIRSQLGPLDAARRSVLGVCALLGDEFDFSLLARVSAVSLDETERAVREAVARRVLTQVSAGTYRFSHALIREVLKNDLSTLERAKVHHRIALALETSLRDDDSTAVLAFHFEQALPVLGSPREPIRYALAAARTAMSRLAFEQARDLCVGALSLAKDRGASVEERAQILKQLAEAQTLSGAVEEAKATYCDLAELGRASNTSLLIVEAARGYGRVHKEAGLMDQRLVALLEEAIGALRDSDDALRAELCATLARALLFDPLAPERRLELGEEAVELARKSADPSTLSLVLAARAFSVWGARDPVLGKEWPRLIESAIEAAEHARDFGSLMEMRMLAVTAALKSGKRLDALALLELAENVARGLQDPSQLYFIASSRAAFALYEGRLSDVPELKARARAAGQHLGRIATVFERMQTLLLARETGDTEALVESVQAISGSTNSTLAARASVLMILTEAGHLGAARRELSNLSPRLLTSAFDINWLSWYVVLGRALADIGPSALCEALYAELTPHAGFTAVVGSVGAVFGHVSLSLGILARRLGNLERSCEHLRASVTEARSAGGRPEQARSHLELARTLLLMERGAEALTELDAAERLASEIGMKKILRDAAALRSEVTASR
jgi:DNA-binding winged helix-turn-helix (wHTH) protein